jgi:hypothetical protein
MSHLCESPTTRCDLLDIIKDTFQVGRLVGTYQGRKNEREMANQEGELGWTVRK